MLESLYNAILFVLAIVGAGRLGLWLMGRHWHWVAKTIVLLIVACAIWGFLGQMGGGPQKNDFRIMTEILASAGTIFGLEYLFHHVRNGWGRFALVALAGIFLFLTWRDSLDRGIGTVSRVNPKTITSGPVPTPSLRLQPASAKTNAQLCLEGRLPFSTCQKLGY